MPELAPGGASPAPTKDRGWAGDSGCAADSDCNGDWDRRELDHLRRYPAAANSASFAGLSWLADSRSR